MVRLSVVRRYRLCSSIEQGLGDDLSVVGELHPSELYLVPTVERVRLVRCQFLLVDVGVICAIEILDVDLGALGEDAGVLSGDSTLIPAVIGQVDIREDAADRILSSHGDLGLVGGERKRGVSALDDEPALNGGSGTRSWGLRPGFWLRLGLRLELWLRLWLRLWLWLWLRLWRAHSGAAQVTEVAARLELGAAVGAGRRAGWT